MSKINIGIDIDLDRFFVTSFRLFGHQLLRRTLVRY